MLLFIVNLLAAVFGGAEGAPAEAVHPHGVGLREVRDEAVSVGWSYYTPAHMLYRLVAACVNHHELHSSRLPAGVNPTVTKCAYHISIDFFFVFRRARAVDTLCRKPFWDYHACVGEHGKGSPACIKQWTAFDVCTENF